MNLINILNQKIEYLIDKVSSNIIGIALFFFKVLMKLEKLTFSQNYFIYFRLKAFINYKLSAF